MRRASSYKLGLASRGNLGAGAKCLGTDGGARSPRRPQDIPTLREPPPLLQQEALSSGRLASLNTFSQLLGTVAAERPWYSVSGATW